MTEHDKELIEYFNNYTDNKYDVPFFNTDSGKIEHFNTYEVSFRYKSLIFGSSGTNTIHCNSSILSIPKTPYDEYADIIGVMPLTQGDFDILNDWGEKHKSLLQGENK